MTDETLRRLGAADLRLWRDFFTAGLTAHPAEFLTTLDEYAAVPDADVAAMLVRREVLGLLRGETLVATIALEGMASPRTAHRVLLTAMLVDTAFQRQGLARRLLGEALARARNNGFLQAELFVAASNLGAIRLYEEAGFHVVGRLPRAMRTPDGFDDDLHMVRRLD